MLLNYSLTPAELTFIGNNCAPRIWLCDARTAPAVSRALPSVGGVEHVVHCGPGQRPTGALSYDDLIARGSDAEPALPAINSSAPSLIMYTSGTTGRPKGVVLSHAAQWINTILMIAELGFQPTDRALQFAPLFHVAAFHVVALPVLFVGFSNISSKSTTLSALRVRSRRTPRPPRWVRRPTSSCGPPPASRYRRRCADCCGT